MVAVAVGCGSVSVKRGGSDVDVTTQCMAGLESCLRVYDSLLKKDPQACLPFLDELCQRREAGTLVEYVEECLKKINLDE